MTEPLVVATAAQLREVLVAAVRDALEQSARQAEPRAVRRRTAARLLDVSVQTIERRIASGALPVIDFGGLTLIPLAAIEALIAAAAPECASDPADDPEVQAARAIALKRRPTAERRK
jgi:excisionase family DNA binding protein